MRRVVFAALLLAGCAAAAPPPLGPPAASADAPAVPAAPTEEWRCGGDLVPPTGWQQDTAFVDASSPGARERAGELASRKLEERLCGADAAACGALRGHITPWKTGSNGKEVCAMSVIKAADLEAWRATALSAGKLEADLEKAVVDLLGGKVTRTTRLVIDRLVDNGIPGGRRADWLRARLEQKLAGRVQVVAPPKGWAGDGAPSGVDVWIRGEIVARREGQVPVVEASLRTLRSSGGSATLLGSARVVCPESVAPPPGAAVAPPPPEDSRGLSVHIDAHQGGSLCAGEHTQVWLKSDTPAFVRVFNLYGSSEGLLTFPDDDNPTGQLKGGVSVPLGGASGFDAVPVPGSEYERFLVISASSEAGLGPWKKVKGPCRLPAKVAKELHQGQGMPPGVKVTSDGYRLVSGESCGTPPTEERRREMAAALAGLPECGVR